MKEQFKSSSEKFEAKSTTYKVVHSIILTIINGFGIYIIMSLIENTERPMSLRLAESILGTMSDIAPPIFWATIAVVGSLIGVAKYGIQWIKEKRSENIQAD